MAELSTFNAGTHIKEGIENTNEPSNTNVTPDGGFQPPINEPTPDVPPVVPEPQNTNPEPAPAVEPEAKENESSFSFDGGQPSTPSTTPTEPTPTVYNWKDEISKVDKSELYQHLGLNDFALKLNDHLLKGGNAADFIAINGIDYETVSDEDLVRQDIKQKFPNLTQAEVNRMYTRKYGIDESLTDDEIGDRNLDLKSAAYQVRVQKKSEQANYKMPEPIAVKDEKYEAWQNEVRQQETLQSQITNYYNEHPTTKHLNETKRVAISLGDGVEPFNIVLDKPEVLTKMMADSALYKTPMLTKTGEPDVARHQLVTLFEANPQKFITDIFNYGKSVAGRSKVAEGQNAQRPAQTVSTTISQSPVYGTGKFNQSVNTK
jgi:hypothetical protein